MDVFAHTVMGRNTSSKRTVFTGGSKQGEVSEITRKNSNTIIRVTVYISNNIVKDKREYN
jgi:hypothetical protein